MASKLLCIAALLSVSLYLAQAGDLTYYDDIGIGACGNPVNPRVEMLAAISHTRWTTANPNNDPLCRQCVTVNYNGKTMKLPIKDKCAGCAYDDVDLSMPAFKEFAAFEIGRLHGAQMSIGPC